MRTDTQKGARIAEWYFLSLMKIPKEGTQERKIYDTLLAAGPTFTYSDYFERVLRFSQFSPGVVQPQTPV